MDEKSSDRNLADMNDIWEFEDDVDECDIYGMENNIMDQFLDGKINLNECLTKMKAMDDEVRDRMPSGENFSAFQQDGIHVELDEVEEYEDPYAINEEERPKSRGRRQSKASKLGKALEGVLVAAHAKLVQGDEKGAYNDCIMVLQERPQAAKPYRSIALILHTLGFAGDALQLSLLAAYLGPTTKTEWMRLFHEFRRRADYQQAIACISRAIRMDSTNIDYYLQRASLLNQMGHERLSIKGFTRLIYKLDAKENSKIIAYLGSLAGTYFHKNGELLEARKLLSYVVAKCTADDISEQISDLYMNTLISLSEYTECLEFISKRFKICLEMSTLDENNEQESFSPKVKITKCELLNEGSSEGSQDRLDTNVLSKIALCLINVEAYEISGRFIKQIIVNGDWSDEGAAAADKILNALYEIGLAYVGKNKYKNALQLFRMVQKGGGDQFKSDPELWNNIAFCYEYVGDCDEAIRCFRRAVDAKPESTETRLMLCRRLKALNRFQESLDTICERTDDESQPVPASLIHEACMIYHDLGNDKEFAKWAYRLLAMSTKIIGSKEELDSLHETMKSEKLLRGLNTSSALAKLSTADVLPDMDISIEQEWDVFVKLCGLHVRRKQFKRLQRLTFSMFRSSRVFACKKNDIKLAVILSTLYNEDYKRGFDLLCLFFISRKMKTVRLWNLFNLLASKAANQKVNKLLVRALEKDLDNYALNMLYANYCLLSGSYRFALNDYFVLFNKRRDPLVALNLAVTNLQIACQRHTTKKTALATQAIYFLRQYERLRGPCMSQEIYYNMGRAFHQLGWIAEAEQFYKKAIETPPVFSDEFDLTQEAAYNLTIIYSTNGCPELAEYYFETYLVV